MSRLLLLATAMVVAATFLAPPNDSSANSCGITTVDEVLARRTPRPHRVVVLGTVHRLETRLEIEVAAVLVGRAAPRMPLNSYTFLQLIRPHTVPVNQLIALVGYRDRGWLHTGDCYEQRPVYPSEVEDLLGRATEPVIYDQAALATAGLVDLPVFGFVPWDSLVARLLDDLLLPRACTLTAWQHEQGEWSHTPAEDWCVRPPVYPDRSAQQTLLTLEPLEGLTCVHAYR